MTPDRLVALALVFAPLSLVSLGGGPSIFAEMQRQAVEVHGWMTDAEFLDLFAISRATPGPGSLIAALVGWRAAGLAGAAAAALGLYLPSSLVLLAVGHWWRRRGDSPARRVIERGLGPRRGWVDLRRRADADARRGRGPARMGDAAGLHRLAGARREPLPGDGGGGGGLRRFVPTGPDRGLIRPRPRGAIRCARAVDSPHAGA
jgi:hypothetical protein